MSRRPGVGCWRAVVIEDHADFAAAVRDLVEADGTVVVEAVCHTLALGTDLVRRLRPELVLTDFRLPDGDAVEQFPAWYEASPSSRIVVTSAWTDDRSVRRARDGGAVAYVDKTTDLLELPSLIAQVMEGACWVGSAGMHRGPVATPAPAAECPAEAAERVLAGILAELSTGDIAQRTGLTEHQVRHEVNALLRTAGVRTRAELRASYAAGTAPRVDC